VRLDSDGFLIDSVQWTPAVAGELARVCGIGRLTDRHWKVIALCREEAARSGCPLDERVIAALSGCDAVELRLLFSDHPAELAARVAGLPNPHPKAAPRLEEERP
jgi:TusE/DsrC/DsvC family sulfur relay protein